MEYIEREAAIRVLCDACGNAACPKGLIPRCSYYEKMQSIPAADVRPVVRCRECKHWETDWTPQGVSDGRHYCAPLDLFPSADWYCSDGEQNEAARGSEARAGKLVLLQEKT